MNRGVPRPKDETKEEKKLRKEALRQEKKVRSFAITMDVYSQQYLHNIFFFNLITESKRTKEEHEDDIHGRKTKTIQIPFQYFVTRKKKFIKPRGYKLKKCVPSI